MMRKGDDKLMMMYDDWTHSCYDRELCATFSITFKYFLCSCPLTPVGWLEDFSWQFFQDKSEYDWRGCSRRLCFEGGATDNSRFITFLGICYLTPGNVKGQPLLIPIISPPRNAKTQYLPRSATQHMVELTKKLNHPAKQHTVVLCV